MFTLSEMAKLETSPIRAGVLANILRKSSIMELLPFVNVDSLRNVAVKWGTLPTVGFRYINGAYVPNEGSFEQVYESVYPFGGEIRFDRIFSKIGNLIVDPKTEVSLQKSTAWAYSFNDYFINGDNAVDPLGFEGLKKRISNMPARQTIDASSNTDILDPTASAANARRFLGKFNEAFYKAGGGSESPDIIVMNEGMFWGFAQVLQYLGASGGALHNTGMDMFDREIQTYKGARFVDAGLKADQTTEIIPVTEDPGDAGNDATSIYFVPFSMEQGISGIQLGEPEIYDPLSGGEMETAPANLLRMEWVVGLAGFGSYGPTRLNSIENPANWT